MLGVPVDYDGGEQVETGHAVVLTLGGAIPDFTLSPDAQGVFQGVMGLTLVQANLALYARTTYFRQDFVTY